MHDYSVEEGFEGSDYDMGFDFGGEPSDIPTVEKVQTALNAQGYGPLVVDGNLGPKTAAAVKAFQLAKGLAAASGTIDDPTMAALGLTTGAAPVSPTAAPADGEVAAKITAASAGGAAVPPHVATAASHGILVSAKGIGGHIKAWWAKVKAGL